MTRHQLFQLAMSIVCSRYGVTEEEILSKARPWRIVWPRTVLAWIATQHIGMNQSDAAHALHKHPSAIQFSRKRYLDITATDKQLKSDSEQTQNQFAMTIATANRQV